jgi:predicted alpha-1,2-mannosidase
MKKLFLCIVALTYFLKLPAQIKAPADYVDPFIGASTSAAAAGIYHGLGKTFPGAATPFGLVQISPNTITGGDNGSGYSYEMNYIEGFAFTQMSGIGWYGDLGNFLVTPATGPLRMVAGRHEELPGYRSRYEKAGEVAKAGYYAVTLSDHHIRTEVTAAPHSGIMRFTFPANKTSRIQIDLARRVGGTSVEQHIKVVDKFTIQGWMRCTPEGGGWGNGAGNASYTVYFYSRFSKPLKDYGVWSAHIPQGAPRKMDDVTSLKYDSLVAASKIIKNIKEYQGKHLGFFIDFETASNEVVLMKTGISFVSMDGAKANLVAEIPQWDFDRRLAQTRDLWNRNLSAIKVSGGTEDQMKIFYTAMYHTMIDPRATSDLDGTYMGGMANLTGAAYLSKGLYSADGMFSGASFPLQTIINPTVVSDMINSLTELAGQSGKGYLERWELLNAYTGCMVGNPAVPVITDAYSKGIRNFNVPKAYQYARNTVEKFGNTPEPHDMDISATLEYGFNEWCLSQMAAWLNHPEDVKLYGARSQAYKTIFDPEKHWFRPKNADGTWKPWPAEGRLKQEYGTVESNPYQQGWFVPHDIKGMTALMGGREKTIEDLTDFFEKTPKNFTWNNYYNHANEPVHLVPFLFNRLGVPWLSQKWVRKICENAYKTGVEGLVGNEDVGQMSAWYVLAASGLHQAAPGDPRYEIFSPLFKKVSIRAGATGKIFKIIAKNNSAANSYIQSARLNGIPYRKCYIYHQQILSGGTLELVMGPQPNKAWGTAD